MTGRAEVGKRGEEEACDFLERKGQTILERNWRHGHLEVDIISMDRQGIHFVEVKSRTAPVTAQPEENIRSGKMANITRAALDYLHSNPGIPGNQEIFFDAVGVVFDGEKVEIEYFPQAWIPMYV